MWNLYAYLYVRGRLKKLQKIWIFFNILRFQAAITPQWLQIDGKSLPKLEMWVDAQCDGHPAV